MAFEMVDAKSPKGINYSVDPTVLPTEIWDGGNNVSFRYGSTKKVTGYEQGFGNALTFPEVIVPLRDDTQLYYWWAYAGRKNMSGDISNPDWQDRVYKITDAVSEHQDVTPLSDPDDLLSDSAVNVESFNRWTGDTLNGVPYITKDIPYMYDSERGRFRAMKNIPRVYPVMSEDGVTPINNPDFQPDSTLPDYDPEPYTYGEPRVTFKTIRTYKNFLIGLDFKTDDYEGWYGDNNTDINTRNNHYWSAWAQGIHQNALWWSSGAVDKDIDVYWNDADPTRQSGWNFLGGAGGPLIDGKALRDSFIIYRERSVWQMTYVGGVSVFAFKELFDDAGCLGLDCVAEIEGQHMVVGQSDVYIHNGVKKQSICDGIIRKEIFQNIDPQYTANVFISVNYKEKEASVNIPLADGNINGACNRAYVYNWQEQTWSIKDIPDLTCSAYTLLSISNTDESWDAVERGGPVDYYSNAPTPYPVGSTWEEVDEKWIDSYFKYNPSDWGLVSGSVRLNRNEDDGSYKGNTIYTAILSSTFDKENFEGYVERTHLDMNDRTATKYCNLIYPLVEGGVVDIYMDGSMSRTEGFNWKKIGTFDPSRSQHIACRVNGRYIHIKFVIPETSRAQIKGYQIEYDKIGRR